MAAPSNHEPKWFKYISTLLPVAVLVFGIIQYTRQMNKSLKEKFRQELWMKKKDLYFELGSTLGSIAAGPNSAAEYHESYKKFSSLYYGNAAMLADTQVNASLTNIMHTFFLEFNYNDPHQMRIFREQVKTFDSLSSAALQQDMKDL